MPSVENSVVLQASNHLNKSNQSKDQIDLATPVGNKHESQVKSLRSQGSGVKPFVMMNADNEENQQPKVES